MLLVTFIDEMPEMKDLPVDAILELEEWKAKRRNLANEFEIKEDFILPFVNYNGHEDCDAGVSSSGCEIVAHRCGA